MNSKKLDSRLNQSQRTNRQSQNQTMEKQEETPQIQIREIATNPLVRISTLMDC